MSGPFGDSSDANRKPRGPRPFAGQVHPPGSGPLKSSRVRRPTLAPFPSLAEPVAPVGRQELAPPPASTADSPPSAEVAHALEEPVLEAAEPPAAPELRLYPTAGHDAEAPFAGYEPTVADDATAEPEAQAIEAFDYEDAYEPSIDALAGSDDIESPFGGSADSPTPELPYATFGSEEDRPRSALHTEELRDRDFEAPPPAPDAGAGAIEASANGDADDWFAQTGQDIPGDDVGDASFEGIDSIGDTLRSMTAGDGANSDEPPAASLPVDWAVSAEGEADLQSYVAETRIREEASEVLEGVARRVRSGEIVLALEPGASTEAVLASILASLLT